MCNIHEHAVLTDIMEPNGSSFIGKHGDDFMPTNDLAWVGFSVEIGPEGGVYILDWHDTGRLRKCDQFSQQRPGLSHHAEARRSRSTRPNLGAMSDTELVQLQMHANDWYVRQARLLLQYAGGKLELWTGRSCIRS